MSKQAFQEFMAQVARDADLRREVEALAQGPQGVPTAQLAALAASKGYSFGAEDVGAELSEEELAGVAGGLLPAVHTGQIKLFPKVEHIKFEAFLKYELK